MAATQWFAVRCIFFHAALNTYEERITLWQAERIDQAVAQAEAEAMEYAAALANVEYLKLAQAFHLFDAPGSGVEVFSLMRTSALDPDAYIGQFFDTGRERQHTIE